MFPREVAPIFARQHGLITRDQAGANYGLIRHRLDTGRWVRVAPGLYRLAGVPVTWRQRALAACLIAGPPTVVSHRSAAVLLNVSGFRPGPVEVTVPPGRGARSPLARVHRSDVARRDRTQRDRIPVTHPARMLADLAKTVPPDLLEEAVDDVLCRKLTTLERVRSTPQPMLLRTLLEAWTPGALPGSPAEMDLVRALLAAGLPDPVRQHWIAEAHARVDLAYPDERIAIEMDSFRWHACRRPFQTDRSRRNRIVAAGCRFSGGTTWYERPMRKAGGIGAALVMVAMIAMGACGDDDETENTTVTTNTTIAPAQTTSPVGPVTTSTVARTTTTGA